MNTASGRKRGRRSGFWSGERKWRNASATGSPRALSFFGPHVFEIGKLLQNGENAENEVQLIFTGSAANVYEHAGLPYGIDVP